LLKSALVIIIFRTLNSLPRARAALVALVRNSELDGMRSSMKQLEERFNRKFDVSRLFPEFELRVGLSLIAQYTVSLVSLGNGQTLVSLNRLKMCVSIRIFLNDEPFDDAFKEGVRSATRANVSFGNSLAILFLNYRPGN
jgi:hypothetical protein